MASFHKWLLAFAMLGCISHRAQAGILFDVGEVTVIAGTTDALLPIFVTTPDGMQFGGAGGFNLTFDVAPTGTGLPSGLTLHSPEVSGSAFFTNPSFGPATGLGVDGVINSNAPNASATITTTPQVVVNLRFDVSALAASATHTVTLSTTQLTSVTNSIGTPLTADAAGLANGNTFSYREGFIRIVAVPEPSSVAMISLGALAIVGIARSRRTRIAG
jgi:hypothetical protein